MQILRAQCGRTDAHDEHWDHAYDTSCKGWSEANASACALAETLIRYSNLDRLDPDLFSAIRLECHPAAWAALMWVTMPDFPITETDPNFVIPVVTDPDMNHGSWRLVVTYGEVK